MKRDFSPELVFRGKPVKEGDAVLTLRVVCMGVLLMTDERDVSSEDKYKRCKLADRIGEDGVQDVSVEEVALIKRLIGRSCQPIVVGPAYDLLEADPASSAADLNTASENV